MLAINAWPPSRRDALAVHGMMTDNSGDRHRVAVSLCGVPWAGAGSVDRTRIALDLMLCSSSLVFGLCSYKMNIK